MPGGGVSAGCIDVVGLAMMWTTIPIQRSHWSRSDVKDAILDHKCHGTVIRDIQEQGITFLYDMRKLTLHQICSTTQVRAGVCPVYHMCITRDEVIILA